MRTLTQGRRRARSAHMPRHTHRREAPHPGLTGGACYSCVWLTAFNALHFCNHLVHRSTVDCCASGVKRLRCGLELLVAD